MTKNITIEEFVTLYHNLPLIDVRSPVEYNKGHIPGAVNLPLLSDQERTLVGTKYLKSGKKEAIMLTLDLIGPQLKNKVLDALQKITGNKIVIHCWRGGMRSSGMSWLLSQAGYEAYVLQGGYKAYRQYLRQCLLKKANFIVIGGMTGSGKTDILNCLAKKGHQVLNLEELANHKGSVFGNLGKPEQPSTQQFENNIFQIWQKFDFSKPIWVEDESINIGRVQIPLELHRQIQEAAMFNLILDKKYRIKRIVNEYAGFDKKLLIHPIKMIEKYLGGLNAKEAIKAIENNDFEKAIEVLLIYYDKAYKKMIKKRSANKISEISIINDAEKNATIISNMISKFA